MFQFPCPLPPGTEVPPPTLSDQVVGFVILYMALLTLVGYCLPRPLFCRCLRILLPFLPDKLK